MAKILIGKYEATIYPEGDGFTGAISLGFGPTANASASSARAEPRPWSKTS
ncbi:hypothetical protein [Nonomuraea glycinis]|uniref:hypothetical protein n=1 Tax=Nonomuraea glycinis TaxID=2047744 RepID=UPI0033B4FEC0